jgi:hypothetical protein
MNDIYYKKTLEELLVKETDDIKSRVSSCAKVFTP